MEVSLDLSSLIQGYLVVEIMLLCLCTGFVIKHLIPTDTINRYIPFILSAVGIVSNIYLKHTVDVTTIISGFISALTSIGMYESFRVVINKPKENAVLKINLDPQNEEDLKPELDLSKISIDPEQLPKKISLTITSRENHPS